MAFFGVSVFGCFEKIFWISKNIIDKSEFYSEVFGWKTNLWIFQLGLIKDNLCILAPRKCSLECGAFFFFLESDHSHFPPPTVRDPTIDCEISPPPPVPPGPPAHSACRDMTLCRLNVVSTYFWCVCAGTMYVKSTSFGKIFHRDSPVPGITGRKATTGGVKRIAEVISWTSSNSKGSRIFFSLYLSHPTILTNF